MSRLVSNPDKHLRNYNTRSSSQPENTVGTSSPISVPNTPGAISTSVTTTMANNNETGAGQSSPHNSDNMARSSNLHLMNTDRFNGVSGIDIGDYISNIEAEVKANKTPEHLIEDQCIKLTRTRLDTTKCAFLKNIARLIDSKPANEKSWEWVKSELITTFGTDHSDPNLILSMITALKPVEYTVRGINSCMSEIQSNLYKWQTSSQQASVKPLVSTDTTDNQLKFWIISLMANIFPEPNRLTVIKKLQETPKPDLARKIVDLLNIHKVEPTINNPTIMVAQSQPTQHNSQQANPTNTPTQYNHPYSPRGGRQSRGNTRGRGYSNSPNIHRHNNQDSRYNQTTHRDNTINKYWPSPRQCLNCLETGHRMNMCRNRPFCAYHKYQGHNLLDCRDFHNITGLPSNTRGNFFIHTYQGEDIQYPSHPDLEY